MENKTVLVIAGFALVAALFCYCYYDYSVKQYFANNLSDFRQADLRDISNFLPAYPESSLSGTVNVKASMGDSLYRQDVSGWVGGGPLDFYTSISDTVIITEVSFSGQSKICEIDETDVTCLSDAYLAAKYACKPLGGRNYSCSIAFSDSSYADQIPAQTFYYPSLSQEYRNIMDEGQTLALDIKKLKSRDLPATLLADETEYMSPMITVIADVARLGWVMGSNDEFYHLSRFVRENNGYYPDGSSTQAEFVQANPVDLLLNETYSAPLGESTYDELESQLDEAAMNPLDGSSYSGLKHFSRFFLPILKSSARLGEALSDLGDGGIQRKIASYGYKNEDEQAYHASILRDVYFEKKSREGQKFDYPDPVYLAKDMAIYLNKTGENFTYVGYLPFYPGATVSKAAFAQGWPQLEWVDSKKSNKYLEGVVTSTPSAFNVSQLIALSVSVRRNCDVEPCKFQVTIGQQPGFED